MHVYEVRPRKDKRGVDLISDALPCDGEPLHYAYYNFVKSHQGQIAWEGVVETFVLLAHPIASRAYGWQIGKGTNAEYKAVLEIDPIDSPQAAVRAAIVAQTSQGRVK